MTKPSNPKAVEGDNSKNATGDLLKSIIERVERLEEEKKTTSEDIREVYSEAKSQGFDTKVLRRIVALRKLDVDEVKEANALLETYLHAIGQEYLA